TDQSCVITELGSTGTTVVDTTLNHIFIGGATLTASLLNSDPGAIRRARSFVNTAATLTQEVLPALVRHSDNNNGNSITIPDILAWGEKQPDPVSGFVRSTAQQLGWGANGEDLSRIPSMDVTHVQLDQSLNVFSYDGLRHLTALLVGNNGNARSLLAKLDAAEQAEGRNNPRARNGSLNAFRNELSAQSGKLLSRQDAVTWRTLSQAFNAE